ncbi:MAG: hypothetical protein ACOC1F_01020 [Myxococcota bacterium]
MHPRAALERVRAACDELHSWQGGGIAFGKKPYLGEVKRNTFRVRTLSFRRDGAVGFLVGAVEPSEGGTKVTYRIESPSGFVHSLPVAALAPAALLGIGGYLAAPVFAPAGAVGQIAFIAACATAGLVFAAVVIALLMRLIRSDTQRLLRFVETTFSTTDP